MSIYTADMVTRGGDRLYRCVVVDGELRLGAMWGRVRMDGAYSLRSARDGGEQKWRIHRPNGCDAVIMVAPGGDRKAAYPTLCSRRGRRHRVTVAEALAVKRGELCPLAVTDALEA